MESPRDSRRVAIIGAGVQGCAVALELARLGIPSDLYDRHVPVSGAGRWNEGKLHLGLVYARDSSLATARCMIKGAFHFFPFFRSHFGPEIDRIGVSRPFDYLVHRDSLVGAGEIYVYLQRCLDLCREETGVANQKQPFGLPITEIRERRRAPHYAAAKVAAVFETPEIAIRPAQLADLIRCHLAANPLIRVFSHTPLERVERHDKGGFELVFGKDSTPVHYRDVVNCAWTERLKFDQQLGFEPPHPWIHRFKIGCHIRGAQAIDLPSFTLVLGAFGDFVNYGEGHFYFSWYPSGRLASSTDLVPPGEASVIAGVDLGRIRDESLRALREVAPCLGRLDLADTDLMEDRGGYIVAWGKGDVNQYETQLHERASIGVASNAGYHSINTGKLTTATLYAEETARRIVAERR